MLSRSPIRSISPAAAAPIAVARRSRVPFLSIVPPAKSRSKPAMPLRIRPSRRQKAMISAQVQMLAPSRPSITTFTTISACRNSATGDSVAASMLNTGFMNWSPARSGVGRWRASRPVDASAVPMARRAPP
ncbi:hypothetical protein WR25_18352 [Diploscapter pachys]|uniref:Uncharacterized protein n=1 Tax=Diploscapter pachys TaxID=2018661 RepID=A0A2A2K9F5_9BILA|nr:hypothetical protein WR25_18352 [Diploscapter pachys]